MQILLMKMENRTPSRPSNRSSNSNISKVRKWEEHSIVQAIRDKGYERDEIVIPDAQDQ